MYPGPRLELTSPAPGYHAFHPDVSLNFQCNRWFGWIGPESYDEIAAIARSATGYPQWIDGYLTASDRAFADDRTFAGAYLRRGAEFFMAPGDPRGTRARTRFVDTIRGLYDVEPDRIPYADGWLPAYDLRPDEPQVGPTVLVFGGFDSYIEEFLPLLTAIVDTGHRIVAFDGPGQGGALEEAGLPITAEWERPVAAVLDHYGLDDVTAVGISMGGGLVIRAAAFEPRIRRAVAWNVFSDELDVVGRQIAPGAAHLVRAALAVHARPIVDAAARFAAARRPVSAWGIAQGMHITGTASPYDFLAAASRVSTRRVSHRVTADVLLLAGADDHYVPLAQLGTQARALTSARSVTTRVFTAAENASNHCQVGDMVAGARTILSWARTLADTERIARR